MKKKKTNTYRKPPFRKKTKPFRNKPDKLYYFLIYKPYKMICQFTPEGEYKTLADLYNFPSKDIYSVGRLDTDSEGLMVLTNDADLKTRLQEPRFEHKKTYWVQVEGEITEDALQELSEGVEINVKQTPHFTKPAIAKKLNKEDVKHLPERIPGVRQDVPTSWISLTLTEGKNRQVRKMTAVVRFPTLRLVRYSIERATIKGMASGDVVEMKKEQAYSLLLSK